ncbi:COMM domain-containing protein 10 [Chelonia mydas]|uniref:COMM domain-containing protein 10 n=1 Tax=Chelonia mydas TaxID=8469 RepID=M7BRQ4_CHEMY|nr:COMM domain-containing protein 10 [Chelonia mydas]
MSGSGSVGWGSQLCCRLPSLLGTTAESPIGHGASSRPMGAEVAGACRRVAGLVSRLENSVELYKCQISVGFLNLLGRFLLLSGSVTAVTSHFALALRRRTARFRFCNSCYLTLRTGSATPDCQVSVRTPKSSTHHARRTLSSQTRLLEEETAARAPERANPLQAPFSPRRDTGKFPRLLSRILQKLHLKAESSFSEEEEEKLQAAFSVEKQDLHLVLETISFILEQAVYHNLKPAILQQQLESIHLDQDKAEAFVSAWTAAGQDTIEKFRQRILAPQKLETIGWQLNLQMAQSTQAKLKSPQAVLELGMSNEDSKDLMGITVFMVEEPVDQWKEYKLIILVPISVLPMSKLTSGYTLSYRVYRNKTMLSSEIKIQFPIV